MAAEGDVRRELSQTKVTRHCFQASSVGMSTVLHSGQWPCLCIGRACIGRARMDLFLHYHSLHCTVLHCTALTYTVLHCTVLYCTALSGVTSPSAVGGANWGGKPFSWDFFNSFQ